jgi:RNA polymerase sigma-70 factor (ECF subfamily)
LSPQVASRTPDPADVTDRRALGEAFTAALARLPERQRIAVVLFDVEGYSHGEIAAVLGIPEGTVRSDVFHARRALREPLAAWRSWKEKES